MSNINILFFFTLVIGAAVVFAAPNNGNKEMTIEPEDYAKYFPSDIVKQIEAVRKDDAMSSEEKGEKLDKIISSVPSEIRDKIPPPPGFLELPVEIQNKYKAIHRNSNLSFQEKQKQTKILFKEMPEKYRHYVLPAFARCGFCLGLGPLRACWGC